MENEKLLLLKLHPTARGLSDETLEQIAAAAELLRYESDEVICKADDTVRSVYLIIHGRLRLTYLDSRGRVAIERFQVAGGQFGGLSAALVEPSPINCTTEDPSVLLRFDYDTMLRLTKEHDQFRANYTQLISSAVKHAFFNVQEVIRPQLTAFFHQSEATRSISTRLYQRLAELGESCSVYSDQPIEIVGIHHRQIIGTDQDPSPESIRSEAADQLQRGRVIFETATNADPERVSRTLVAAEQVFWCVTPDNWEASIDRLRQLETRCPKWRDKINIVWLLDDGESVPIANELRELAIRDFKIYAGPLDSNHSHVMLGGFERLLQFMRGIQIGIALGGGAARGMAHLGVLKALEENGITIDAIAGTSAGAMTGTLYAAGLQPDFLVERFVNDLRPSWLFRLLPRGDQWYLLYKYRRGQFDPMLRKYLDDRRLEQLPIPMHTITVDLISAKAVIRESGDAVHGIVESINLPVLSTPINRHGQALVDGGLINNVPADVLKSKGCNVVIAVSVTAKMEYEFAGNRPDTPVEQMRPASTIQTLLRGYLVQSHSVNAVGVQPADFVIEPDVRGFELSEFSRTDELAKQGESATLAMVSEIKHQLHQLDPELYPESP